MDSFPVDVWHEIGVVLRREGDTQSLLAGTMLSHTSRAATLPILYRAVSFIARRQGDPFQPILYPFESNPVIAAHLRALTLHGRSRAVFTTCLMRHVLRLLPNLQEWHLDDVQWALCDVKHTHLQDTGETFELRYFGLHRIRHLAGDCTEILASLTRTDHLFLGRLSRTSANHAVGRSPCRRGRLVSPRLPAIPNHAQAR
ncbi:hypothetical protein NM688_g3814 [Phlebia brevispora]|uniref:Uncharacterized protein n=1 Tax=Phlebia brevispora TaxID=194682 RepID=A0ACC1T4X8_9APHY|nr:hypothetical protein NM688_g3814 [Phlebia brevispora]